MTAQMVLTQLVPPLRGPVARAVLVGAAKFIVAPLLQELSLEQPARFSLHSFPSFVGQAPAHAANAAALLPTGELLKSRQLLAIECQKVFSCMCQTVGLQNEAGGTPCVAAVLTPFHIITDAVIGMLRASMGSALCCIRVGGRGGV